MIRTRTAAVGALVLALLAGACSTVSDPALTVGDEEFSHGDIIDELDDAIDRRQFYAIAFAFCPTTGQQLQQQAFTPAEADAACPAEPTVQGVPLVGDGAVPRGTVEFIVGRRIFVTQIAQEFEDRGLTPAAEDVQQVDDAFAQDAGTGSTFLDLVATGDDADDEAFVERVKGDISLQFALQRAFETQDDFNAFLSRAATTVELNGRYGTWDPITGSVVPPDGPVADPAGSPVDPFADPLAGF